MVQTFLPHTPQEAFTDGIGAWSVIRGFEQLDVTGRRHSVEIPTSCATRLQQADNVIRNGFSSQRTASLAESPHWQIKDSLKLLILQRAVIIKRAQGPGCRGYSQQF
jgi:hypothetical protein